jgi:hypothetical protein
MVKCDFLEWRTRLVFYGLKILPPQTVRVLVIEPGLPGDGSGGARSIFQTEAYFPFSERRVGDKLLTTLKYIAEM